MTTASGAPDAGNWFDAIFKNPFENFVHAGEAVVTEEAAALFETAKAQAAQAAATQQQAIDAAVNPLVTSAITGIVEKVPVLGTVLAGGAASAGTEATDAVIDAIVKALQGGKTTAAPAT